MSFFSLSCFFLRTSRSFRVSPESQGFPQSVAETACGGKSTHNYSAPSSTWIFFSFPPGKPGQALSIQRLRQLKSPFCDCSVLGSTPSTQYSFSPQLRGGVPPSCSFVPPYPQDGKVLRFTDKVRFLLLVLFFPPAHFSITARIPTLEGSLKGVSFTLSYRGFLVFFFLLDSSFFPRESVDIPPDPKVHLYSTLFSHVPCPVIYPEGAPPGPPDSPPFAPEPRGFLSPQRGGDSVHPCPLLPGITSFPFFVTRKRFVGRLWASFPTLGVPISLHEPVIVSRSSSARAGRSRSLLSEDV